ncbi:Uncharacterised protein [Campylobacter jejuni]|nr:Uncharacterised protein [Campylobacter jejuni]
MLIPFFWALMLLPDSRMILPKWVLSGLVLPPSSRKPMPFNFDSMVLLLVRVPILLPDSINTPLELDLIIPSLVKLVMEEGSSSVVLIRIAASPPPWLVDSMIPLLMKLSIVPLRAMKPLGPEIKPVFSKVFTVALINFTPPG